MKRLRFEYEQRVVGGGEIMDPLTPPDCDLRSFAFMPLDVARLRDSELVSEPDGEVFRANVLSWCASWHQIPAGSLPDDDATLARLLGYGRDVKGWVKIRAKGGLRGWISCTDGRLYHPVVCEKAIEAMEKQQSYRERTEAARVARQQKREHEQLQKTPQSLSHSLSQTNSADSNSIQGKGQVRDRDIYSSDASSSVTEAFDLYAALAAEIHLPVPKSLSPDRKAKLAQRLGECGGIDGWRMALDKIRQTPWLRGENDRGWRVDLDFLLQRKSFVKLIEGSYDSAAPQPSSRPSFVPGAI